MGSEMCIRDRQTRTPIPVVAVEKHVAELKESYGPPSPVVFIQVGHVGPQSPSLFTSLSVTPRAWFVYFGNFVWQRASGKTYDDIADSMGLTNAYVAQVQRQEVGCLTLGGLSCRRQHFL